jgi:hypothetical protein
VLIAQIPAQVTAAFNQSIDVLGLPATFSRAKVAGVTVNIPRVGFANVSKEDEALVNAYGFSAKVITVKAADIGAPIVEKFDVFHVGTERYTVDTVIPIHAPGNAVPIGYKTLCKGR